MKIKPLYDYIVVDVNEQKETTKSGFFLPSSSDGKMLVTPGDTVLFPVNSVIKAKVEGEDVSIISQTDVLAIVE